MPDAKDWLDEIKRYHKASRSWRESAKKIVDRYRLEESSAQSQSDSYRRPTFNLLWSNTQTMQPSLFSRIPEIIAERRHRDRDPVGRIGAEVMQRAANEEIERNDFKDSMDKVVLDLLLVARGVPWVRYEAEKTTDGDGVTNEKVMVDYVHWDDFAHSPERCWADVVRRGWVARRTTLDKAEGVRRFGAKFARVPMTMASRTADTVAQRERDGSTDKYAEVWEIWDAVSRQRIFVAEGVDVLEAADPQYNLTGFFCCPRPAYGTLTNEDLMPVPDYNQYRPLAEELDDISWRIRNLTKTLRLVGLYDASAEGLGKALDSEQDGKMVAVSNMAGLLGKSTTGGLDGLVQFLPISEIAQTLIHLYQARDQVKQTVYEVTGISDIVRGEVDPREKATQSKIKANFATQRLDQRRRAVERTARDTARIQVELMVELYSPETIREQSGFDLMREVEALEPDIKEQLWAQVIELLKSEHSRGFRVDVETDSTVEMDAGQTREARTEFLQSAGQFLNNALPVMQSSPDLTPLMTEMLLFTVRGYRAGRTLETSFEEAAQKIRQKVEQAEQQPQQPPPDPKAEAEAQRIQQQMQLDGAKGQAQMQQMQQKGQLEAQKGQLEAQLEAHKGELEAQKGQIELAQEQAELQALVQKLELEIEKLELVNEKMKAQIKAVGQKSRPVK